MACRRACMWDLAGAGVGNILEIRVQTFLSFNSRLPATIHLASQFLASHRMDIDRARFPRVERGTWIQKESTMTKYGYYAVPPVTQYVVLQPQSIIIERTSIMSPRSSSSLDLRILSSLNKQ
jgi:hypothetical protein